MRLILVGLLFIFGIAQIDQEEIQQIDAKIEELIEIKRGYEGRAIWAENQADRMQFEDKYTLETRRYYQIAEENRQKAERIQEEIDRLRARKEELLEKRGSFVP